MPLVLGDVREEWERVRPGLEEIADGTGVTWRPEDIYAALVHQEATLLMGDEGFVVVKFTTDPYTMARGMLIWVAWGQGGELVTSYLPELKLYAKGGGAKSIIFRSDRKGWGRIFEPVCTEYAIRLEG